MPSEFDQGIADSFYDGVIPEMGDTITLNGVTIDCNVMDRANAMVNIKGGKELQATGSVEVKKDQWIAAGGTTESVVTFSDGVKGRVSRIDDFASLIYTLTIGPVLQGATGPGQGRW